MKRILATLLLLSLAAGCACKEMRTDLQKLKSLHAEWRGYTVPREKTADGKPLDPKVTEKVADNIDATIDNLLKLAE